MTRLGSYWSSDAKPWFLTVSCLWHYVILLIFGHSMAPSSKQKDCNPPWIVRVAWLVRWGLQHQITSSVWTLNPVTIVCDWIWSTAVEFVKQVNHSLIHEHKCLVVIVNQFYWDLILAYFIYPPTPRATSFWGAVSVALLSMWLCYFLKTIEVPRDIIYSCCLFDVCATALGVELLTANLDTHLVCFLAEQKR